MNPCTIEDCDRPIRCKGLCNAHYQAERQRKRRARLTPEQRRREAAAWSAAAKKGDTPERRARYAAVKKADREARTPEQRAEDSEARGRYMADRRIFMSDEQRAEARRKNKAWRDSKERATPEQIATQFIYDPNSGIVTRVATGTTGSPQGKGYLGFNVNGVPEKAHRIAWCLMTGAWPTLDIDHINHQPGDNRWSNLREVTRRENTRNTNGPRINNSTGYLGVTRRGKRFIAQARGRYLGMYPTAEEAHRVYLEFIAAETAKALAALETAPTSR